MSRRADVSVAIATYNGAKYLPEMLDSILNQTVQPAEIVCSDDASTDRTVAIIESYASASDIPIKLVKHETNVGIINNFLDAFRETTERFVAYCDQDDVWFETKLEQCFRSLDERVAMVCHPSLVTDGDLNSTNTVYYDIPRDLRFKFPSVSTQIYPWGHQIIVRRDVIKLLLDLYDSDGFRDSQVGANFDVAIPFVASMIGDLCYIKDPQMFFRRHEAATSSAGLHEGDKPEVLAERVVRRTEAMKNDASVMRVMIDLMKRHSSALPADCVRVLESYQDRLELYERRVLMAKGITFLQRLKQLPSVLHQQFLVGFDARRPAKDLAADLLAVLFGTREHS